MLNGPGQVEIYSKAANAVSARLFNFDVAKASLKREHRDWLISEVVPILKKGGIVSVVGLASPSYTEKFNLKLSRQRRDEIIAFLRRSSSVSFRVIFAVGAGEFAARFSGLADNVEDDRWRGVQISVYLAAAPPPPPPPLPTSDTKVQRAIFAKFKTEIRIKDAGATAEDGPAAPALADGATDFIVHHYIDIDRKYGQVPANYKLSLIAVYRDSSGSINVGSIGGVDMTSCLVDYNWTKNLWGGPLLLFSWWRTGVYARENPLVFRLSEAEAQLWYDNPPKALKEATQWEGTSRQIPYSSYLHGDY
jgi:hypothetical protein